MFFIKLNQLIITIGLALDILGAIFLAKGFMAKKIQRIISESGTYYNRNKWFQDSLIQQKFEAVFGMIFLFSGFTCQAIGNFASSTIRIPISPFIIFPLMVIILVILFLTFSKLIKYLTKRKIFKAEAIYHKDELDKYETGNLDHCGECLEILRERDENDDNYKRRIKEKICSILKINNIIT